MGVTFTEFTDILRGIEADQHWGQLTNKEMSVILHGINHPSGFGETEAKFSAEASFIISLNAECDARFIDTHAVNSLIYDKEKGFSPYFWFQIKKLKRHALIHFENDEAVCNHVINIAKRMLKGIPVCISATHGIKLKSYTESQLAQLVNLVVSDSYFYYH